jgi:hypothetical protein
MAAFHKLHFRSVAPGSQEWLDFFYRQPEASFKLFIHNVLPEHCQLLIRSHWTKQQSPFTDDYSCELLARPAACAQATLFSINHWIAVCAQTQASGPRMDMNAKRSFAAIGFTTTA